MEIQSDLIILPATNHLPLPWSVRGPLGLETGAEVSIALVESSPESGGLPDIIVTPLQSDNLKNTFTVDVELGERAGAVADFLTQLGDELTRNDRIAANIVLSETITLEGRNKHKIHLVLEPASDRGITKSFLNSILNRIKKHGNVDLTSFNISQIYNISNLNILLQQRVPVKEGWIEYSDWKKKILELHPDASIEFDLGRVVVSSNPDQRLLRFIIPKRGVIELKVPHHNTPGALKEISDVIRMENYNILSMRLSRTPPANRTVSTSVCVAACEPMLDSRDDFDSKERLKARFKKIDTKYMIDSVSINRGKPAHKTLFLTPKRKEFIAIDDDISRDLVKVREEIGAVYFERYRKLPKKYVFLSKRFISNGHQYAHAREEQEEAIRQLVAGIEESGCAVIEAANPGSAPDRYIDRQVFKAVFSRLWASDACAVLAINEKGGGDLSLSIAHEIGFFAGRAKPIKVFVTEGRDKDPVFGNIVGMNRVTYADGMSGFMKDSPTSLYRRTKIWVEGLLDLA